MFDTTKEIEITIYSGGNKRCVMGWPSDADWKRRARKIRFKSEAAGGEKTKSSVIGAEPAALELFEKNRRDTDGAEFDAAEALEVIDRLEFCVLQGGDDDEPEIDLRGDRITVRMGALRHRGRALFTGLVHVLKHPSMRQIREYRMGCVDMVSVRRGTEMTQPLGPGEVLYDQIVESWQGYAGPVPVVHKDFIITRILEAIKDLEDGGAPDA